MHESWRRTNEMTWAHERSTRDCNWGTQFCFITCVIHMWCLTSACDWVGGGLKRPDIYVGPSQPPQPLFWSPMDKGMRKHAWVTFIESVLHEGGEWFGAESRRQHLPLTSTIFSRRFLPRNLFTPLIFYRPICPIVVSYTWTTILVSGILLGHP